MPPASILITGANGFAGQHLLPALKTAFPAARLIPTGLDGHDRLDVTDKAAVAATFTAQKPDFCIHLAAISAIGASRADPEKSWAINCHGTINLGRAILEHAPSTRLIFISTAEVYGASFKPGLPLPEIAPLLPQNTYAATKAAAEMALCALAAEGLRVLRLRPFNHTGPAQREDFVVPAFAAQIARIEAGLQPPEILVGNLDSERDFLDIADICAAYTAAIQHFDQLPNNTVLNLARPRHPHRRHPRQTPRPLAGKNNHPPRPSPPAPLRHRPRRRRPHRRRPPPQLAPHHPPGRHYRLRPPPRPRNRRWSLKRGRFFEKKLRKKLH